MPGWRKLSLTKLLPATPLGMWLLLAWITGLTLTTPLYRPYPRLILPWMTAMAMAAGLGMMLSVWRTRIADREHSGNEGPTISHRLAGSGVMAGGLCLLICAAPVAIGFTQPVWQEDRTGLQRGAISLLGAIEENLRSHSRSTVPGLDCVLYVIAEPGLYFHLAAREDEQLHFITQPASDLGMLSSGKIDRRVPAYLITGLHAHQESRELNGTAPAAHRVRKVAEIPYAPSPLVLLDDMAPAALPTQPSAPLELWSVDSL